MKKQMENAVKKSDYTYIEKNIYKAGKTYRVRVGNRSEYAPNITQARKLKKLFKSPKVNTSIF